MPIFDFRCTTCNTVTEKIVPTSTKTIECPNCSGIAEKQVSAPGGFKLKGAGFYKPSAAS